MKTNRNIFTFARISALLGFFVLALAGGILWIIGSVRFRLNS